MSEAREPRHVIRNIDDHNGHRWLGRANRNSDSFRDPDVSGAVGNRQDQHRIICCLVVNYSFVHAVLLFAMLCIGASSLSVSRAIVVAASGCASPFALTDIRWRAVSSCRSESAASAACRALFVKTPAPASAIRSALRRSGPGIASKITNGKADIAASAVVRPPG